MRTTLDLPDDLIRQAKILAVQRGSTLRELVAAGLQREVVAQTAEVDGHDLIAPLSTRGTADQRVVQRRLLAKQSLIERLMTHGGGAAFPASAVADRGWSRDDLYD